MLFLKFMTQERDNLIKTLLPVAEWYLLSNKTAARFTCTKGKQKITNLSVLRVLDPTQTTGETQNQSNLYRGHQQFNILINYWWHLVPLSYRWKRGSKEDLLLTVCSNWWCLNSIPNSLQLDVCPSPILAEEGRFVLQRG